MAVVCVYGLFSQSVCLLLFVPYSPFVVGLCRRGSLFLLGLPLRPFYVHILAF